MSKLRPIIVIVGPTASGKSDLGIKIAKKIRGEIVSADSRQVYKGLDIGTGKITKKEMQKISHHCLDIASPQHRFSVREYQKAALGAIEKIRERGNIPILIGGTGFYIDAVLFTNTFALVPPQKKLRATLEKKDAHTLFVILQKLDPERAHSIDKANKRRVIRAIEIAKTIGRSEAPLPRKPRFDALILGLKLPQEILKKRIGARTDQMMRSGLVNEVRRLRTSGVGKKRMKDFGFEYVYPLLYITGTLEQKEVVQKIKTGTWQYAKRQMTWFRKTKNVHWVTSTGKALTLVRNFLK